MSSLYGIQYCMSSIDLQALPYVMTSDTLIYSNFIGLVLSSETKFMGRI